MVIHQVDLEKILYATSLALFLWFNSSCTTLNKKDKFRQREFDNEELNLNKNKLLPLIISSNRRYLTDSNGKPVPLIGEAAWTLPENCTREEIDFYLNARKKMGFNYVQIVAARDLGEQSIEHQTSNGTMNPKNRYGFRPFKWNKHNKADINYPVIAEGGSPTSPNDYWDHLEYIIQQADRLGLYIGLLPTWGKYYINNRIPEMRIFTESNAKTYGYFLGERYKAYQNILWILGGDTPATAHVDARMIYRSMAEGIVNGITGGNHRWYEESPVWEKVLITYHGRNAAAQYFNNDCWLKINMVYEDDPALYKNLEKYYRNTPIRPMIQGECWYEGWVWTGDYKSSKVIRRQIYHTFLGGALGGYVYGVASSGKNVNDPLLKFQPGWKEKLYKNGARQIGYLKLLLDEHKWWLWEPCQEIIVEGKGTNETLKAACKSDNEILVYFADTSAALINTKLLGNNRRIDCCWFDPQFGNIHPIGKLTAGKELIFQPPSDWEDAVLILENYKK